MSLEALRAMGLLRAESGWDGRHQSTGVAVPVLVAAIAVSVGGCVAMVLGDGGRTTWLGVASFLVGLFGFVGTNLRGVGRRRRRRAPPPPPGEAPGPN